MLQHRLLGESAVPAYTNNRRMVMTPDLAVWKELYLYQLDGLTSVLSKLTIESHYHLFI